MAPIAFVTALYEIRPGYWSQLLEQFERLVAVLEQTGDAQIFVWTDRGHQISKHPHVSVLNASLSAFETWSQIMRNRDHLKPPRYRNLNKDTVEYMALMNCKAEMLWRVWPFVGNTGVQGLAWIDAGIMKIFRQDVSDAFRRIQTSPSPSSGIVIPGCWSFSPSRETREAICWRFCGGFCVVPLALVDRFYWETRRVMLEGALKGRIVWEVNVWAELEKDVGDLFRWYPADHNETILNLPNFGNVA
jgi:hypothetical protein